MTSITTRWIAATLYTVMIVGCASGIDLSKIPVPQIVIAPPPDVKPDPPIAPKPMATVAFHVTDADSGQPIPTAIATFEDETQVQANDDGYIAIEKELNTYQVKISAREYVTHIVDVILIANRQFDVKLASSKPKPVEPPVVIVPPPVVAPPAPSAPVTDDDFKAAFFAILKKHGNPRTVNLQTLNDTRAEIEAIGCEWQHDSAGTLRPRLFLPVAPGADIYSRAFDVGLYGEQWQWIKR